VNQFTLIQQAITASGTKSELARKLQVQRQRINAWEKGENLPEHYALMLAEIASIDPVQILAEVRAEAIANKWPAVSKVYKEMSRRLNTAAAIGGIFLVGWTLTPYFSSGIDHTLYIMSTGVLGALSAILLAVPIVSKLFKDLATAFEQGSAL
jgi:DNA-binding XRE family transcriptional regulator